MKKTLLAAAAALFITTAGASAQMLLSGFDFTNGTPAAASPNAPLAYVSAFGTEAGTAALYLDGTHGSSTFINATTGNEVSGITGTAVNAGTGFSTTTTSPSALSLKGGTGESANGKSLVFTLSTSGYQGLVLTFATARSGTGFTGNIFSYSTDGTTFTALAGTVVPAASYATTTEDFSAIAALNNASTVYIEYTLAGATGTTGSNSLDNIQFNATAVPEPATCAYLIGGLGLLGIIVLRRRVA